MIKTFITFLFIFFTLVCNAQYRKILIRDTSNWKSCPLTVLKIESIAEPPTRNYLIDRTDILSIKKDSTHQFNNIHGDTATIIQLRKGAKLLNLKELLAKYRIPEQNEYLPVFIDSVLVFDANLTFFQLDVIKSVKVKKEKGSESKYISVKSIYHTNNPIADVYIWGTYTKPTIKIKRK